MLMRYRKQHNVKLCGNEGRKLVNSSPDLWVRNVNDLMAEFQKVAF